MQIVLFTCFFAAETVSSVLLFHIAPGNPICLWYTSALSYGTAHLITSLLVALVIAAVWWFIGNLAFWGAICRTRQRGKVLFYAGLAGIGIDLVSSLLARSFISSFNNAVHLGPTRSIVPWLMLRCAIWTVTYTAVGTGFLRVLQLQLRSRRIATGKPPQ